MTEYFEPGERVCLNDYTPNFPQTRALLNACEANPFVEVVELRLSQQPRLTELIVIDAGDATIEHASPSGIKRNERLAIRVSDSTTAPVEVLALRKDFPSLSHLNHTLDNEPKSLCLYNVDWSTTERTWTAPKFLQRIFWWLRQSAIGQLHRPDQPLEQLFYMSPYQLFLPADSLQYAAGQDKQLAIHSIDGQHGILRAVPLTSPLHNPASKGRFQLLPIEVAPLESHEVVAPPQTLGQLHDRLVLWGSDLVTPLADSVKNAFGDGSGVLTSTLSAITGLVILIGIPRTRQGVFDRHDVLGYLALKNPAELANMLDFPVQEIGEKSYLTTLIGKSFPEQSEKWRSLPVKLIEIRRCLDSKFSQKLSGIDSETADFRGVLAGVGALGSLLADIWAREAWGSWTYVDPDRVLPHNLSRHIAVDANLGLAKVEVVRAHVISIFPDSPPPVAIHASVTDDESALVQVLSNADVLVDVTTTLGVPRELSNRPDCPRLATLFITPSGNGCVLLLEDQQRDLRSKAIEAQYYRAILNSEWGEEHLANHHGDIWVGGGCRDISVKLAPERIHLHAGILARQLRRSLQSTEARACVWVVNDESDAVTHMELELQVSCSVDTQGWKIIYDRGLVAKFTQYRREGLPRETGGMLLGVTDTKNMEILVVDALTAPLDSEASACHFIRGKEGQQEILERCHQRTANLVDYIGEWHSHPSGYPSNPSADDRALLASLTDRMSNDGLPMLMVIVAEDSISFTLGVSPVA